MSSIAVAEHKARASANFRRPTKVFEDGLQKLDNKYLLSLDGIIASRGGIPRLRTANLSARSAARARTAPRTRRRAWPAQRQSTSKDLNRPLLVLRRHALQHD